MAATSAPRFLCSKCSYPSRSHENVVQSSIFLGVFKVAGEAKSDGSGGPSVLSERSEVRYGDRWELTNTADLGLAGTASPTYGHVTTRRAARGWCAETVTPPENSATRTPRQFSNCGRQPLAHCPSDDPEPFEDRVDAIWRAEGEGGDHEYDHRPCCDCDGNVWRCALQRVLPVVMVQQVLLVVDACGCWCSCFHGMPSGRERQLVFMLLSFIMRRALDALVRA